jgi:hypothetical protein
VPLRQILASFTPAQLDRYESFRRSFLNRKAIKKLALAATGGPPPTLPTLIVLGGLGKHFCGELVEEGRRVMADRGEAGPLRPVHVQEAHRRLAARGALPRVPRFKSVLTRGVTHRQGDLQGRGPRAAAGRPQRRVASAAVACSSAAETLMARAACVVCFSALHYTTLPVEASTAPPWSVADAR